MRSFTALSYISGNAWQRGIQRLRRSWRQRLRMIPCVPCPCCSPSAASATNCSSLLAGCSRMTGSPGATSAASDTTEILCTFSGSRRCHIVRAGVSVQRRTLVLFNALAVTALICKQAWEQCYRGPRAAAGLFLTFAGVLWRQLQVGAWHTTHVCTLPGRRSQCNKGSMGHICCQSCMCSK